MDKKQIRKEAIERRNAIPYSQIEQKSLQIQRKLQSLDLFTSAKEILLYFSIDKEVQTIQLIQENHQTKKIYLPILKSKTAFEVGRIRNLKTLEKNMYRIPEPKKLNVDDNPTLDLIIVPGVAFDKKGGRLGMGKGYYDRFLAQHKKIPRLALAFEEQILDEIPKGPYDEDVDFILTEKRLIDCQNEQKII